MYNLSLNFSPDGTQIVTGGYGCQAIICDA